MSATSFDASVFLVGRPLLLGGCVTTTVELSCPGIICFGLSFIHSTPGGPDAMLKHNADSNCTRTDIYSADLAYAHCLCLMVMLHVSLN